MNLRSKLFYKVNNEIVCEEDTDNTIEHVEKMKWILMEELECLYDDIEVEKVELPEDASEYDMTSIGLVNYKDLYFVPRTGLNCSIKEGTDEWLDAFNNGTLINYIYFTTDEK